MDTLTHERNGLAEAAVDSAAQLRAMRESFAAVSEQTATAILTTETVATLQATIAHLQEEKVAAAVHAETRLAACQVFPLL